MQKVTVWGGPTFPPSPASSIRMDALSGEEPSNRLGYDDFNECFASKDIMHATASLLGVTKGQLLAHEPHTAFMAITMWIGGPKSDAAYGGTFDPANCHEELMQNTSGAGEGWFSGERAAAFWSAQVLRKTFFERRTWCAA